MSVTDAAPPRTLTSRSRRRPASEPSTPSLAAAAARKEIHP